MSPGLNALVNARRGGLPAGSIGWGFLQYPHRMPVVQSTEFEQSGSVALREPGTNGSLQHAPLSSMVSVSAQSAITRLHDQHSVPRHDWAHIQRGSFFGGPSSGTIDLGLFHPAATNHSHANDATILPERNGLPFAHFKPPMHSSPFQFLLVEQVKRLLHQQKIRDARHALEIGLIHNPGNRHFTKLLRAISPGRVSPKGWTSNSREREVAWIKQHGDTYRGQWIALDGDQLIAIASTLKDLLESMNTGHDQEKSPLIQLLPE